MSDALIARWDAFLGTIATRFGEVMEEARAGCAQLLVESDYDFRPMMNAWSAMARRAQELGTRVEETWSTQVERKFEEAGAPADVIAAQRLKGDLLGDRIEDDTERVRLDLFCEAARALGALDEKERGAGFTCRNCGAPLEVPRSFRALNLTCPHCQSVCQYEPSMRARLIENACLEPVCRDAAWAEYLAMRQAERAFRRARPHTLQHIQRWEAAQLAYHRRFFGERLEYVPNEADTLEADVRGRMEQFYAFTLQYEPLWIAAGRPRAI